MTDYLDNGSSLATPLVQLGAEPAFTPLERAKPVNVKSPETPPNKQDALDKPAKLLDSIANDLAHAILHAQRVTDKGVRKDRKAVKYNASHAQHHLLEAQGRVTALVDYLSANASDPDAFKAQIEALRKLQKKSAVENPPKPLKS